MAVRFQRAQQHTTTTKSATGGKYVYVLGSVYVYSKVCVAFICSMPRVPLATVDFMQQTRLSTKHSDIVLQSLASSLSSMKFFLNILWIGASALCAAAAEPAETCASPELQKPLNLKYWNGRGLMEIARMTLAIGGKFPV